MTDLLQEVELVKLAHDLDVDVDDLAYLRALSDSEIADLRRAVNHALFAPHEPRFARLAGLGRHVPHAISARGAQLVLGPRVAARAAGVTDPDLAVRLVEHMSVKFLAAMTPYIDPARVAGIVARLPEDVVVGTGERLVAAKEYIPLGRFVAHVPLATALRVVRAAPPADLLQVAIFTDDRAALDAIIAAVEEDVLAAVLTTAASSDDLDDALTLLACLALESRARVVRVAAGLDDAVRDGLVAAVERNDAWEALAPVLDQVEDEDLRARLTRPGATPGRG